MSRVLLGESAAMTFSDAVADDGRQDKPLHILLFAESTSRTERRSGVHRVTMELANWLGRFAPVDFVKWNTIEGQLGYFDSRDLAALFRTGSRTPRNAVNPFAHRVNDRFGSTLDPDKRYWLVFPEISYHLADGNETYARIISQCREYGVKVASIFYDIIPITNRNYQMYRPQHLGYVTELSRSDLIIPISHHVGTVLESFYAEAAGADAAMAERIQAVPLPEGARIPSGPASDAERDTILMVGTVEPRKRQVEALQALNRVAATSPEVSRLKVVIIGSLHPDSAVAFHDAVKANPNITYHDYSSAEFIERCYQRTLFTIFASNDEGYGLPISESIAHGIPCLTANFGSMGEIAEGGGCLTVDVDDEDALAAGILTMSSDPALRERLRREIAARPLRDWADYAGDVVRLIDAADAREREALDAVRRADAVTAGLVAVRTLALAGPDAPAAQALGGGADFDGLTGVAFLGGAGDLAALPAPARAGLCASDAVAFRSREVYAAFLAQARADGFKGLLPTEIVVEADEASLRRGLADALQRLARRRNDQLRWAMDERRMMTLARHWKNDAAASPTRLTIVISTYNRSPFVCENVRWLLSHIGRYGQEVQLAVVDNTSTDDSWAALQQFAGNPQLHLHRNTSNTGMLGNLRVCSTLRGSRHFWVTGDDDYIVPEELDAVVKMLREEPALPLAFVNFGVYFRERFTPGEHAAGFIGERHPLAPHPSPAGIRPVNRLAAEHDNLFTAVYPIIFRSDILAACFNYPFTGIPFVDLVESVPTTKIILESYARCDAYWHDRIGIVGNAHNSWARHRPRWHALLMPMVFERAREAGVANETLYGWSQSHRGLYDEAIAIARDRDVEIHLEEPGDLAVGERVFRETLHIPPGIRRWSRPVKKTPH